MKIPVFVQHVMIWADRMIIVVVIDVGVDVVINLDVVIDVDVDFDVDARSLCARVWVRLGGDI